MVVLLDTAALSARERREAVVAAMREAGITAEVTHLDAKGPVEARIGVWDLGSETRVLRRRSSGIRLVQTPRRARQGDVERVSLSVLSPGAWHFTQEDAAFVGGTALGMVLTDHSTAYEFGRQDIGETIAINVERLSLGLPMEVIRAAISRVPSSPLYELVLQHLLRLGSDLDSIDDGPASVMLGSATTELVRALISTVADSSQLQRTGLADTLTVRIEAFIQLHLADPRLTPDTIAKAHNISLRQLYSIWPDRDLSLAQWIMRERLELARRELAKPGAQPRMIAEIAHRCGFVNATHFARRFREAYELSPREWRQMKHEASISTSGQLERPGGSGGWI